MRPSRKEGVATQLGVSVSMLGILVAIYTVLTVVQEVTGGA